MVMSLVRKLQIPDGQGVCVINPPARFQIDAPITTDSHDAVLSFAADSKTLMKLGKPAFEAAKAEAGVDSLPEGRPAWHGPEPGYPVEDPGAIGHSSGEAN
jgi:hypothetical protein